MSTVVALSEAPPTAPSMPRIVHRLDAVAPRKRRRALMSLARSAVIVGAIGLAVVIPLGWGSWVAGLADQTTDNAYLRADTSPVSAEVGGRVSRVVVGDYRQVKAGDTLVEIEDTEYAARVAEAVSGVAAARAAVRNAESRLDLQRRLVIQSEAGTAAIVADRDRSARDRTRQEELAKGGWSTAQRVENSAAEAKRFEAQLAEKQAGTEALRQQIDVVRTEIEKTQAELASREAALELARIQLARTRITSPIDGYVGASSVRGGQYVRPGSTVISVVPLSDIYVVANYKETQLARVRAGQPVTLTVDMFPGRQLTGRVERLSPASGSEFALLPADNATGNFTKVAQRIAVRIGIDAEPTLAGLLRPGMSVVATVHTDPAAEKQAGKNGNLHAGVD